MARLYMDAILSIRVRILQENFFWKQLKSIKSLFKKFILTSKKIEMVIYIALLVFFFLDLNIYFCCLFAITFISSANLATSPKIKNENSFSLYYIKENKLFASKYFLFIFLFILADIILLNKAPQKKTQNLFNT